MKIAFYISNHGFGHATRSYALMKEFIKLGIFIYINTDRPKYIFKNLNPKYYHYRNTKLDFGVFQKDLFTPDNKRTKENIIKLYENKENLIKPEISYFKKQKIDLIISDLPHLAFDIAAELHVPSVAISNFNWHFIYQNLFSDDLEMLDILSKIKDSYEKCTFAIKLPFSSENSMEIFREKYNVGILAQQGRNKRKQLIKMLDIHNDNPLILYGFGGEGENPLGEIPHEISQKFNIISRYNLIGAYKIPTDLNYSDLIASVDIVITKVGYSTLAETVQHGTFLITTSRDNYPEDNILNQGLKPYTNHIHFNAEEFQKLGWNGLEQYLKKIAKKKNHKFRNENSNIATFILKRYLRNKIIKSIIVLGTNNFHLLMANVDSKINILHEMTEVVGLGKGMKNNIITNCAINRAKKAFNNLLPLLKSISQEIEILGTSCSREAENLNLLSDWIYKKYNLQYKVISEEDEALYNVLSNQEFFLRKKRYITFDLGGGSTEFSFIENCKIKVLKSYPIGILRFQNLYNFNETLMQKEINNFIDAFLNEDPQMSNSEVIIIGGTATSIAMVMQNLHIYDKDKVHGKKFKVEDFLMLFEKIKNYKEPELEDLLSFEPLRKSIFLLGLKIIKTILLRLNAIEFTVSDNTIPHGYLIKKESKKLCY